jgi:hypothetical protein
MAEMGGASGSSRGVRVLTVTVLVYALLVAGAWVYEGERHRPEGPVDVASVDEPASDAPLGTAVVTPDGDDKYGVSGTGDAALVAAPVGNAGSNLRMVLWRDTDAVSADQQSCATFEGSGHDQQPGIALRIRSTGGRTQAITVTKNVWHGFYGWFNFHLMDSAALEPFRHFGSADLSAALLLPDGSPRPYPWRMCALVVGDLVQFVAWPEAEPQPAWGDPTRGASARLPAGWDAPGRPGVYVAHLRAGQVIAYRSVSTQPL